MSDTTTAAVLNAEELRACWAAILTNGRNRHDSPLLPYEHTAAADAVTLIQQHIETLTAVLEAIAELDGVSAFFRDEYVALLAQDNARAALRG